MFDTENVYIASWVKVGRDLGYDITPEFISKTMGLNVKDANILFKKHFGDAFPYYEAREKKIEYATQYIKDNGIPIKEGLYELIEFLEEKSILKAVATSTERERAEDYLTMANLKDKFDLIVCGDNVSKGKPDPDIFLTVAKGLNCLPKECIVLEDSENGLKAAIKAGMKPIFVPDINRPSKEVQKLIYRECSSLLEVKNFLSKELNS